MRHEKYKKRCFASQNYYGLRPCEVGLTFSDFRIIIYSDLLILNMNEIILSVSDRGQVTIPYKLRDGLPAKRFICTVEDGAIVLRPFQSREEFVLELEESKGDWDKNGGLTLDEMKKKYNL